MNKGKTIEAIMDLPRDQREKLAKEYAALAKDRRFSSPERREFSLMSARWAATVKWPQEIS